LSDFRKLFTEIFEQSASFMKIFPVTTIYEFLPEVSLFLAGLGGTQQISERAAANLGL
jgi:hypothetical protein